MFTSCHVCFTAHTVLDGLFPYLAHMITSLRGCVACNDLWPWPISSKSFSHGFAIEQLKYGISCRVRSTAWTVFDGLFPYLVQMITTLRGCVTCNDLWPWPVYSRLFSCDFASFMHYIHVAQIQVLQPMRGRCVTYHFQVNWPKVKVTQVLWVFAVGAGVE